MTQNQHKIPFPLQIHVTNIPTTKKKKQMTAIDSVHIQNVSEQTICQIFNVRTQQIFMNENLQTVLSGNLIVYVNVINFVSKCLIPSNF